MLAIGFIVASTLLTSELKRKGLDPNLGSTVTLMAVVFGIIGSKILYLFENWNYFVHAPFEMTFSPGGLTWYGGFILATLIIAFYAKKKKIPFLTISDAAAPGLMLGYGVARIGCHLAGDGDYGMPTNLPWAMMYSKGTYPPSAAFREFPEVVQKYGVSGIVPDTILVHPAPLYEFLLGAILFGALWKLRKNDYTDGKLFMMYLVLAGSARFLIEFIRLNPRILFNLSEAQLISLVVILIGIIGFRRLTLHQEQLVATTVQ